MIGNTIASLHASNPIPATFDIIVIAGGGGGGAGYSGGSSGGGGAGGAYNTNNAVAGTVNTGSGGGGSNGAGSVNRNGASGGSGLVLIRYAVGSAIATGGNITVSGGYTYHAFISSGTFTRTA